MKSLRGRRYDISTGRGLSAAERYKSRLENQGLKAKIDMIGYDKIRITGVRA